MAYLWPGNFFGTKAVTVSYLGLVLAAFFAGFVQFNLVANRGALAYALWIVVFVATVYFYKWIGAVTFAVFCVIGSKMAFQKIKEGIDQ